jgi:hypothetical protein
MKKQILLLLFTAISFAQNPTKNASGFYAGSGTMNSSAIGQFDSTAKGFLFPRMTTAQRNAIVSPATSLVIYNTTTSAYNYWNGTAWTTFGGGATSTLQQVTDALLVSGFAETTNGISASVLKTANFIADGYMFGISDNYDSNYNLSYAPYVGLVLDDFSNNTTNIGFGNINLNGYDVLTTSLISGTSSQYIKGDGSLATLPVYTLSGLGGQPLLSGTGVVKSTAGTISYINGSSSQYIKGDGSLATLPVYTLSGLGGQPLLSGTGIIKSTGGTISYISGTSDQYVKGDGTLGTYTSGTPTLQQVLDNNHDLTNGTVKIGTLAGDSSTGINKIAIGQNAASGSSGINQVAIGKDVGFNNSGSYTTAIVGGLNNNTKDDAIGIGNGAGSNNTGNNFIGLGFAAGLGNTYNDVKLFGKNANATGNGQIVFSKDGANMARFGTSLMSASRQYDLPDDSGTLALLNSPTFTGTPNAPTQNANDNTTKIATTAYADAKVQNSLTSSTTVAPSATAVNTALAGKQDSLGYKPYRFIDTANAITVTGTTAETTLLTITIPPNSFAPNDVINIPFLSIFKIGTAGNCGIRLRVSSTNTMSTATQIGLYSATSTQVNPTISRHYSLNGGFLKGLNPTTSVINDIVANGTSQVTAAFDTTITQYLFITVTNGSIADSTSLMGVNITN